VSGAAAATDHLSQSRLEYEFKKDAEDLSDFFKSTQPFFQQCIELFWLVAHHPVTCVKAFNPGAGVCRNFFKPPL